VLGKTETNEFIRQNYPSLGSHATAAALKERGLEALTCDQVRHRATSLGVRLDRKVKSQLASKSAKQSRQGVSEEVMWRIRVAHHGVIMP